MRVCPLLFLFLACLEDTATEITTQDPAIDDSTRSLFDVHPDVDADDSAATKNRRALDNAERQSDVTDDITLVEGDASPLQTAPTQCDVNSHSGCVIGKLERCLEPGRYCGCLSGYVRNVDTGNCVAAQFFQGTMTFVNTFSDQILDTTSQEYKAFIQDVQMLVFQALVSQGARGVLDVYVTSVSRERETGHVRVDWELAVASSSNPQREELMMDYNKGIVDMVHVDPRDSLIKLNDTNFVLGPNGTLPNFLQPFVEFSHCVDKDHNYCDDNADCFHSLGTFVCTCRPGFDDVSPDLINTPGELCAVSCNCENNGTCIRHSSGNTECSCPKWFSGSRCQVNGEEILIITCSVLAALLVLVVVLCLVRICISKRSRRCRVSGDDSACQMNEGSEIYSWQHGGCGSLDTSVVKLPRVWMDSARPYELPPRDPRRWSYVSDPVKYMDEYMMDDYVHAGTLPLPRSHDAKKKYYAAYPAGTMNHAYSSCTLPARPFPRH